jgi:hypothetical protein
MEAGVSKLGLVMLVLGVMHFFNLFVLNRIRTGAVDEKNRQVQLTRRNLQALLAKLDGHPPGSKCTIAIDDWEVKAVENHEHYTTRRPGVMHPDTELLIA